MADDDTSDHPDPLPPPAPPPPPVSTRQVDADQQRKYAAQMKIVQENMADYADVCRQKEMQFLIVNAIEKENVEQVRSLLEEGVNPNAAILFTRTPLVHAIEDIHEDIAIVLIQGGADVNMTEKTFPYRSPVHIAALNGMTKCLQELYNGGADINVQEATSMFPLHFAAWRGHFATVTWLLQNGGHINAQDDFLRTPLHRAVEGNHLDVVKLLLEFGADIDSKDRFGWTALFHCVICDKPQMVNLLLSNGIEVNTVSHTGNTPLHAACARLRPVLTKVLLSAAPDPIRRKRRIPFPDFEDELVRGDFASKFEISEALVDHGADVNIKNSESFSALYLALFFGQSKKLVHFLTQVGARLTDEVWVTQELYRSVAMQKGFADVIDRLDSRRNNPPSLVEQCRRRVRSSLGRNISLKICELPLPRKLKDFLNLCDFYEEFSG